jgi:ArsR family transcriptional regulator
MLRPGGTLLVVDFAPHEEESLRRNHQHRRLGFSDAETEAWLKAAGLTPRAIHHLAGDPLTVTLWAADKLSAKAAAANDTTTPPLARPDVGAGAGHTLETTS